MWVSSAWGARGVVARFLEASEKSVTKATTSISSVEKKNEKNPFNKQ